MSTKMIYRLSIIVMWIVHGSGYFAICANNDASDTEFNQENKIRLSLTSELERYTTQYTCRLSQITTFQIQ